ncbi:hypothetical protein GHT06_010102 [Daphnia sinensis]|uniref:Uncharacterized protein n=1 Tax=Daphnia sinensis TaxID=1820382 RepID=A0AAD5PYQ8_9CRUS|nr:hypothetical protein GHT06_010102 [Daphnia sinensis]
MVIFGRGTSIAKRKVLLAIFLTTVFISILYVNAGEQRKSLCSCSESILDASQYTQQTNGHFLSVVQRRPCHLRQYNMEDTVSCLDRLSSIDPSAEGQQRNKFHIAFVGDSRIRIQYLSFLKLIPDYDRNSKMDPTAKHKDADMVSPMFGDLLISFRWRPLIAGKVVDDLIRWIDILDNGIHRSKNSSDYPPDVLIIGMASWDMLQQEGDDHLWYQDGVQGLVPLLQKLMFHDKDVLAATSSDVRHRKIIWLNQYTTFDFFADNGGANRVVYKEKLQHYNQIVRQILRGSGITVWDSGDVIAEEAVRACKLHHRYERVKDYMSVAYINCKDYIHAGYVALQQMTQLLYNDVCNN